MNRLEHLRRWQAEFERYRSVPLTSTERMRILWRQKRRLLRFLLSNYGSGTWRPSDGDIAPSEIASAAALTQSESPTKGTPPKDSGQIRHVLKSIHGACEPPQRGPLAGGLKHCWITVATFKSGKQALFLESLQRHRIPFELLRQGKRIQVQVLYMDSDRAWHLLEAMRAEVERRRRDSRFTVASEPVAVTYPHSLHPMALVVFFALIWLAPTIAGCYLGGLADEYFFGRIELLPGRTGFRGVGLVLGLIVAGVLHACLFSRLWNWRLLNKLNAIRLLVYQDSNSPPAVGANLHEKNLHQNP